MVDVVGYAALQAKEKLQPFSFKRRDLRPEDVLIEIQYCGICHSDVHQARDEWGGALFPMVPGHEIVGRIVDAGAAVTLYEVGELVGVGCFVDSCRECAQCREGEEQYCSEGMVGTYNSVERDGNTPTYGGYSSHIVIDQNYVLKIPKNLPPDAAAPLLCAGITLYSPLRHWHAGPGKKVAIVGLGGLGHMGVKLASAMGAEVSVLSHSSSKREDALTMGARNFYITSDKEVFRSLQGTFDLIINTVSANLDWNAYLNLLKVNGTMVVVGIPENATEISAFPLVMGRRQLAGSLIGGIKETQEMLDFCGVHGITCEIEKIPIQKVNEAYERMLRSDVRYRFVIDMNSLRA